MQSSRRTFLGSVMLLALTLLGGCGNEGDAPIESPPSNDPVKVEEGGTFRLVSLAPALTQMLVDMKQAGVIVGVAQNDATAPKDAVVVGNYLEINYEKLVEIKPTHVFMMVGKEGAPARLKDLAKQRGFELVTYAYPNSVSDVADILFKEDEFFKKGGEGGASAKQAVQHSLGAVLDLPLPATTAKFKMLGELANLATLTEKTVAKPRVLLVIGTRPVMASGDGTVLDNLMDFIHARNAGAEMVGTAPTFDREKIKAVAPDVVLIIEPGGAPLEAIDKDERLAEFRGLEIPAVKNGAIRLVTDAGVLLPSSNLGRAAATLARAVHPELAAEIDKAVAAESPATAASRPAATAPDEAHADK